MCLEEWMHTIALDLQLQFRMSSWFPSRSKIAMNAISSGGLIIAAQSIGIVCSGAIIRKIHAGRRTSPTHIWTKTNVFQSKMIWKNLKTFVIAVCYGQNDFRRDLDSYQQLCDNCNKENCPLDNKGCNLSFVIRWSVRWLTTEMTSTLTWVYKIFCVYQNWTYQVDTVKHCHWYSCCRVNVWYFCRMFLHGVIQIAVPFFSVCYGSAEYKEV